MLTQDVGLGSEQQQKRMLVLGMCQKFVEAELDKSLVSAYDELGAFLMRKKLIVARMPVIEPGEVKEGAIDSASS